MTLVLIDDDAGTTVVPRVPDGIATAEQPLRDLIFAHPNILPLTQLEPEIGRIIAVATEVTLPGAGRVDALLISEYGRLIIVECKLWRNPQARREVVGQVLDYARELARYEYEDLLRVVSSRVGRRGNVLYELARAAGSPLSEADFGDRVARDLAAGRFLLIVAGDGITEATRRLGEYLAVQPGLAFDFGLVEINEYRFADPQTGAERRIFQPRLLGRTANVERFVIRSDVPGISVDMLVEAPPAQVRSTPGSAVAENQAAWRVFFDRFVADIRFDDPAQMPPRYGSLNWMRVPLPGPAPLSLYRSKSNGGKLGAYLEYKTVEGFRVFDELLTDRDAIDAEFIAAGFTALNWNDDNDSHAVNIRQPSPLPWDEARDAEQRDWLGRVACLADRSSALPSNACSPISMRARSTLSSSTKSTG